MRKLVIIDNGHGYDTPGKRSPEGLLAAPGEVALFEHSFNRDVACRLFNLCRKGGIEYRELVPEAKDISISTRCERANYLHEMYQDAFLVSIHANAGGGTGPECFVYENRRSGWVNPESARIATVFAEEYIRSFPEFKLRKGKGNELFKRANYQIQRETTMPSVLTESGFMDHPVDLAFLISDEGRQRIAQMHFDAIKQVITNS